MFELPTRKPDYLFNVGLDIIINVWQNIDHFVLQLPGKMEIIYNERGKFKNNDVEWKKETGHNFLAIATRTLLSKIK